MFELFKKKKEKEKEIDLAFDRVTSEIRSLDAWDDPKKLEHYILDSLEQIVGITKEIEAEKTEYRNLSSYLDDIVKIESLDEYEKKDLLEAAQEVVSLTKARKHYENAERRLTEEQFLLMEENESEVISTAKRMAENEKYQHSVKKNMRYLEGQKSQMEMDRDDYATNKKILSVFAFLLGVTFISVFTLFFLLEKYTGNDFSWFRLFAVIITGVLGVALFTQFYRIRSDKRKSLKNLNKTITLLNGVRMRYANVTSAITYVQDKYNVKTAAELELLWEHYQEEIRDKERFLRNNKDLEFYLFRMQSILENMDLYDMNIFIMRPKLLLNPSDLESRKQKLVKERSVIRDQIQHNTKMVASEREEIDKLMKEHEYYVPEIMEIIGSVDRLCGLRTQATVSAVKKKRS